MSPGTVDESDEVCYASTIVVVIFERCQWMSDFYNLTRRLKATAKTMLPRHALRLVRLAELLRRRSLSTSTNLKKNSTTRAASTLQKTLRMAGTDFSTLTMSIAALQHCLLQMAQVRSGRHKPEIIKTNYKQKKRKKRQPCPYILIA